ncbi:MAG: DNRLRE domain-containing protein [Planctomycetota bacterium]|nr:DNRLRE domain-containing protein [Planctomycetota bacterium]
MNQRLLQLAIGPAALVLLGCAGRAAADLVTLYPTDDSMIKMSAPDNNYGANGAICLRNRYGSPQHPDHFERDGLIRFDLSELPPDSVVTSAVMSLYYYKWKDNNPVGRLLTCYRLTSDWDEDTVTWNTRPSKMDEPTCESAVPGQPGQWMDWDVTSDVDAFLADPDIRNFGWEIMDEEPWGQYNIPMTYFYTKEYSDDYGNYMPHLTVDVVPGPATLTLLAAGALKLRRRR